MTGQPQHGIPHDLGGLQRRRREAFLAQVRAFQESRAILTAIELDLFAHIGDRSLSAADLAKAVGAHPRGLELLLNALVALGLLAKTGETFWITDFSRAYLVADSPDWMGGPLQHLGNLWDQWSTLSAAVRTGGTVLGGDVRTRGPQWIRHFISAMDYFAQERVALVAEALDVREVKNVLDLGGGSGAYAIAIARANPRLRAVVFDLPQVVPLTLEYIRNAGLEDRISVRAGDYTADDLGGGFDLALLFSILHIHRAEVNQVQLRKVHRALRTGGRIAVQDFFTSPDHTSPLPAALFALNMLVGTPAGRTYSESEVRHWLEAVGFHSIHRLDVLGPAGILMGRR